MHDMNVPVSNLVKGAVLCLHPVCVYAFDASPLCNAVINQPRFLDSNVFPPDRKKDRKLHLNHEDAFTAKKKISMNFEASLKNVME